jgi:hypothetical protein
LLAIINCQLLLLEGIIIAIKIDLISLDAINNDIQQHTSYHQGCKSID